jgi:hypothetical protein
LSQLDTVRSAPHRGDGERVFAEQWHAQVIAVVELMVANGTLDAAEWSKTLGAELDQRASEGAEDTDANYYSAFLSTLERVLESNRFAARAEVDKRESDWRQAYLSTPHGKPVTLKTG